MNHGTRIFFALLLLAASTRSAQGAIVQSADEVCAPATDPCVISTSVEVDPLYPLDFGLRTVRVIEPGSFVGSLDLACGRFESATPATWMSAPTDEPGEVTITASRSCSLDPSLECLSDAVCTSAGAGLCSGGDGGIAIQGTLKGNAPTVVLRAAGDVLLEGTIKVSSSPPASYGGTVYIESKFGSVESTALIDANGGVNVSYYGSEPALGGSVTIRAAVDVTLREKILATGGTAAIEVDSGNDTVVAAGILTQGRQGADYHGGTIDLHAGRDLNVVREAGMMAPVLNIMGGSRKVSGYYGYGGGSYGGAGGYAFLNAGRDVVVGESVVLLGDTGMSVGELDDLPISGDWYFEAGEDLSFDAALSDRAWGQRGFSNHGVSLYGDGSVRIGRRGTIATSGAYSGTVAIDSDGPVTIDGRVNARSRKIKSYGYSYGTGGDVWVQGSDATIRGKIMTGGPSRAGEISVDVCRLHLQSGGRLDSAWGAQADGATGSSITIGESMVTERGSGIRGREGALHAIRYRDAAKPPVLRGSITPAPGLVADPLLYGCPICGNLEIDQDETCDDGNLVGGDGCDSTCNVEP